MHDDRHKNQYDTQHEQSAVVIVQTPHPDDLSPFTCQEWIALLQLRRRYQAGHDLWSAHEVERLRFLRWLYRAGRIES